MDNQEISVLNDLLHITNDRKEGFEKVEGKVWEMYPDVKDEYEHMISQSKIMKNELINLITEKQGTPEDSTSMAGAVHRTCFYHGKSHRIYIRKCGIWRKSSY